LVFQKVRADGKVTAVAKCERVGQDPSLLLGVADALTSAPLAFGFKEDKSERREPASEDRRIRNKNVIGSSGGFSFQIGIYVGQTSWNLGGMSKPALLLSRDRLCASKIV
jgi:hypothetical protein